MIVLDAVAARRAPLALTKLTLAWGPGAHAVVGGHGDGGPLLLALVAGRERLRSGRVQVLDGKPEDAGVRVHIAWVPREPVLPEALRVGDVLGVAAAVRGDPPSDPALRLAALGVEALADRPVRSISPEEAHAVALAEAVTSSQVRVLLLEEPLAGLDPRAAPHLAVRLRARAAEGCAVLVATSSLRDAGELADDHVLLRAGSVVGRASSLGELSAFSTEGVRMRVVCGDPQALLAALANEDAVEAVARRDAAVIARGRDATALAAAVGRAVTISGTDVVEIRMDPPSLEDARSAAAGIATATYDAAYARTRAELAPPPTPAPASPPPPEPAP